MNVLIPLHCSCLGLTCNPPEAILFRSTAVSVGTYAADAVDIGSDFVVAAAVGERNPPRDGVAAGSTGAANDGGSSVPRSSSRSRLVFFAAFAGSGFLAALLTLPGLPLDFLTTISSSDDDDDEEDDDSDPEDDSSLEDADASFLTVLQGSVN